MWIFTKQGFLSIVEHRDNSNLLLVRARSGEHLAAIFPFVTIQETPSPGYRYRATVPRDIVQQVIAAHIADLDYDEFEQSIADGRYRDACYEVWRDMFDYQDDIHSFPVR